MRPSLPSKSVRGGESGSSKQLAFHFVAPIELVHDECPLCAQPGSKPEAVLLERHVRSALKSRHRQTTPACPFGAKPGSHDLCRSERTCGCFRTSAQALTMTVRAIQPSELFDHGVGAREQRWREREPKRLRRLEITGLRIGPSEHCSGRNL